MSVSKRLRYEVLRRDNHTCRYCGAKAPDVKITVDHVVPVALGGSDNPSNLVAACGDCNGGKTSSSPDAPLVSEVAAETLKWAAAMKSAQAAMVADINARTADRAKFQECWNNWTRDTGNGREPLPMDTGWQFTVDQLTAAGLPITVLRECIDIAMSRTSRHGRRGVDHENVFRYMCGVAWSKVTELQEAAQKSAGSGSGSASAPEDRFIAGQLDVANRLLALLDEDARTKELERADDRDWCRANDEPIQAEDEIVVGAAMHALESAQSDLYRLGSRITKALKKLPGDTGQSAMRDARTLLFANYGAGFSRDMFLCVALDFLDDELAYPEADALLSGLSNEASAEWIALALEAHRGILMTDKGIAVRAAERARHGQRLSRDRDKCLGPGEHTPVCLGPSAYLTRIAGWECCKQGGHMGHRICERHLAQLVDGTFKTPDGEAFSVTDFIEYDPSEDPWAA